MIFRQVNDIKFHPVHGTLAVARYNGTFSYVDMKRRTVLKESKKLGQPIHKCCFNGDGKIFAYSTSCSDRSKVCTMLILTKPLRSKVTILLFFKKAWQWGRSKFLPKLSQIKILCNVMSNIIFFNLHENKNKICN